MTKKMTEPQRRALEAAERGDTGSCILSVLYVCRSRGWLTDSYELTDAGLDALDEI